MLHRAIEPRRLPPLPGWTVTELLVSISILITLALLTFSWIRPAFTSAYQASSANNLRNLAAANLSYAADHGRYCPATEPRNRVRWHGARSSGRGAFDPTEGFLADYLGNSRAVTACPAFKEAIEDSGSFELGSGGYGYNAAYIGGSPPNPFLGVTPAQVLRPAETLMFATTALAKSEGLQEYPFAEPPRWIDPNRELQSGLQPSVHFRFNGRALIAWCDGHITSEPPTSLPDTNYFGGDNEEALIGFPGPLEENGWWNPRRSAP
jgi:type II secretory pathway pseudopilin PulG